MSEAHVNGAEFSLGNWIVRPNRDCIERDGRLVRLAPKAMAVLLCLARASGEVVSRQELFDCVWPACEVTDDALTQRIGELRKALGDSARNPEFIETIPKVGFRLIQPGQPLVTAAPAGNGTPADPGSHTGNGWKRVGRLLVLLSLVAVLAFLALRQQWPRGDAEPEMAFIAVLPFVNVSNDSEQEFFSDGISIEVLNTLSRVPGLQVISRSSSFLFKGKNNDIPTIASRLGVSHVLDGAVQKVGDQLRITVQLLDAEADRPLWAQTYDREYSIDNLLAIQREVAQSVALALQNRLMPAADQAALATPTTSIAAFEAYLLARQRASRRTKEGLDEAIRYLREAVALDAGFTLAWAEMSKVYLRRQFYFGAPGEEGLDLARASLEHALQLDEGLGEVQAVLGLVRHHENNLDEAAWAYNRALELNPSNVDVHLWKAVLLRDLGQWDEALVCYEDALKLDPLSVPARISVAFHHQMFGQFDEAMEQYDRLVEIDSTDFQVWDGIGSLQYGAFNRLDEAVSAYGYSLMLEPHFPDTYLFLGLVFLDLDMPGRARTVLELLYDNTLSRENQQWYKIMLELHEGNLAGAAELAWDFPEMHGGKSFLYQISAAQVRNKLLEEGRVADALAFYREKFPRLFDAPGPLIRLDNYRAAIDLALVYQLAGNTDSASLILESTAAYLETRFRLGLHGGYWISDVQVLALQGKSQQALAALKQAVEAGWRTMWWYYLGLDPNLNAIREEPEFKALEREIRLDVAAQMFRVYELERDDEAESRSDDRGIRF